MLRFRDLKTQMRIGFIIPYFYPAFEYGGTPRVAYEFARCLVRRGHEVTVVTTDSGGAKRIGKDTMATIQDNGLEGIRIFYYPNLSNYLAYKQRVFLPLRLLQNVSRHLVSLDVVHIHEFRCLLSVAAHSALQRLHIPYVLSPHGGLQRLGKVRVKSLFDRLWGQEILKDAAAVCAVSDLEIDDARQFGVEDKRICLLPNPINDDYYRNLPEQGGFIRKWNLGNKRLVLFLGRLHWIKGIDVLIDAIRLIEEIPDLHLVIAGPDDGAGNQLKSLVAEKRLEQRVTFTGLLDETDRLGALIDSEILALPSRREGFPLAVLEALACQTPVILTSACDLGNWMQNQPVLVTFRSGDAHDLAQKINTALYQPPAPEAMLEGSNFILNNFSVDALAQKAERLYQSLI